MKIRMDIEYKGAAFAGWQLQNGIRTIQGEIEKALKILYKKRIPVIGAGRTDSGVHAAGQVAHAVVDESIPLDKLKKSINGLVHKDITVNSITEACMDFHARHSAKSRIYRYLLSMKRISMYNEYIWTYLYKLNISQIKSIIPFFLGRHNFINFCIKPEKGTTFCSIKKLTLKKKGSMLEFTIEADRFLHKMVRMIIGALLEVGRGKISAQAIRKSLKGKNGHRIGTSTAARGLTLVKVKY